jgi:CBS domain-containing protein
VDKKRVKDLMMALDDYAVVSADATLLDAIEALDEAQTKLPPGKQPHRAVLVLDSNGKIIGKIGQLAVLKALEPKYGLLGDLGTLAKVGVSSELVSTMMEHFRFFQDNLSALCARAATIKARDVMHPVEEHIDENATLSEGIHKIVMTQTLSLLVTSGSEVVGLLRLSDLFDEISRQIKNSSTQAR